MTAIILQSSGDLLARGSGGDLAILDGHAAVISIPGGSWLLDAEFVRQGSDLLLLGEDGARILVRDYFAGDLSPPLVTDTGKEIVGDLAARLAGPRAAGYAQAGATSALVAVGKVGTVTGQAEARHPDGSRTILRQGDPIHQGDVLQTVADGRVGLVFDDGSTFALGGRGRLTIDEYVYDPAAKTGHELVSVVSGTFSFVSGAIARTGVDAMAVRTPVATIGIRGTKVAGTAAPEGERNTVTLLPNDDGTIGSIAVSNSAGTQVLSMAGATTLISSSFAPPPPPTILSPQQIQSQYGTTLQSLPPSPPQPDQQQQQQQQGQAQGEAVAAQAQAQGEAQAKAAEAEAKAEQAPQVAAAMEARVGEVLGQVLGLTAGEFGPLAGLEGAFRDALAMVGPQDPFAALAPPPEAAIGALALGPEPGEMMAPGDIFAPDSPLMQFVQMLGETVEQTIVNFIDQGIAGIEEQAMSRPSREVQLTSGAETVTLIDGTNDWIFGTGQSNNILTVSGRFDAGDLYEDPYSLDTDKVTLNAGGNTLRVANVEQVDLGNASGVNNIQIGSDGSTSIWVGDGEDNLTGTPVPQYSTTGDQTWTIYGNLSGGSLSTIDSINMSVGSDTLRLATAGDHSVEVIGAENITLLDSSASNILALLLPVSGVTITGTTAADTLYLAGANIVTVDKMDVISGGASEDVVTLAAGGQTVDISDVEVLIGGSGADVVHHVDTLNLSGVMVSGVETLQADSSGGGATSITADLADLGSVTAIVAPDDSSGSSDFMISSTSSASADLTAVNTWTNVTRVTHLGSSAASFVVDAAVLSGVTTFVSTGAGGSLTSADATVDLTNLAAATSGLASVTGANSGSATIFLVDGTALGEFTTFTSAVAGGTVRTAEATLDVAGKTLGNIATLQTTASGGTTIVVDTATLSAVATIASADATGTDLLQTAAASLNVAGKTLTDIDSLQITASGDNTFTVDAGSLSGITAITAADTGGTDTVTTADASLALAGKTLTNIDTIASSAAGATTFTVDATLLSSISTITTLDATGIDKVTTTAGTLDVSGETLADIDTLEVDSDNNNSGDIVTIAGSQVGTGKVTTITFSTDSPSGNVLRGDAASASLDLTDVAVTNVGQVTTLRTTGATIYGTTGDDIIQGNTGDDVLAGGQGNDTLIGGAGADSLNGETGSDVYRYTDVSHVGDLIQSFEVGTDKFQFLSSIFGNHDVGGDGVGPLDASKFYAGADLSDIGANAAGTYFAYDQAADALYYDADANWSAGSVQVADVTNDANVTATDIELATA